MTQPLRPMFVMPAPDPTVALEARLERGTLEYFGQCPFPLPEGDDLAFLFRQRSGGRAHKNISYNPTNGRLAGHRSRGREKAERLARLLETFGRSASDWLAKLLPGYARAWQRDRVTLRPEEEATRKLRLKARNDLLHIDAFPSRPSHGRRILRLYVNISTAEPRVWSTSQTFGQLLERYGAEAGLPFKQTLSWSGQVRQHLIRLIHPARPQRSVYDEFMLRFHDFLKLKDDFQDKGPRRFWSFPPGSAWLAFTDTLGHAELRGRYALEHSFFVARDTLLRPEMSPSTLLEQACGVPVLARPA